MGKYSDKERADLLEFAIAHDIKASLEEIEKAKQKYDLEQELIRLAEEAAEKRRLSEIKRKAEL